MDSSVGEYLIEHLSQRYIGSFCLCAFLCVVLEIIARNGSSSPRSPSDQASSKKTAGDASYFGKFQINYLIVYSLAMFSDWLQGPYVYELYVSYGFNQQQIAELFVCGFGSSMIVGTFV